jgi:hypothetical protein
MIRSRRADELYRDQPLYARTLGLRHVTPSGFLCFVFLEGAVALGFLLALAELVSWWGVLVLPITVAVMVKLNDVVAGALTKPAPATPAVRRAGRAVDDLASSRAKTVDLLRRGRPVDLRGAERTVDLRMRDRPADLRGAAGPMDLRGAERTVELRRPGRPAAGARPIDGVAVARTRTDEVDLREQRARQSAARRYE